MPPLLIISLIIFKLLYLCEEKQSRTHLTRTPCGGLLEYIYISGMSPGRDIWMASSLPRRKRVRALAYQVIVVRLPKLDELNLAISIVIKDILSYTNRN